MGNISKVNSVWPRFRKSIARTRTKLLRAVGLLPPVKRVASAASDAAPKSTTPKKFDFAGAFAGGKFSEIWSFGASQVGRLSRSEAILVLKAGGEVAASANDLERVAAQAKTASNNEIDRLAIDCFLRLGTGPMVAGVEAALRLLAAGPEESRAIETARYVTVRISPGGLSTQDLAYLESLAAWLVADRPSSSMVVSREMAIVEMTNAETQQAGVDALEKVGSWLENYGEDRGILAHAQRFLPRHLARIQSGDTPPNRARPLEDAERMAAYIASKGAQSIRRSAWWRWQLRREAATRALRRATPKRQSPSALVFLTEQDTFLGPLYDAMKGLGWAVSQHRFAPVAERYKGMMDLRYGSPRWLSASRYTAVFNHALIVPMMSADIVVCEFASANAVWASRNLKPNQRLFLHLHAYEAFSVWPWMIDWGGVDGVIYVSEPVRALMAMDLDQRIAMVPATVIPNLKTHVAPSKRKSNGKTLGMLGTIHRVKQPHLALEVLEALREKTGEDWRLQFAGRYFPAEDDNDEAAYKAEFERRLAGFPEGTVSIEEFTDDVPAWFARTDYLLSCSLREGTHEVINEAMHHGAIPVVRNWPVMKHLGGPAAVYPILSDLNLVYESVSDAVDIIMRLNKSPEGVVASLELFSRTYSDSDRNASAFSEFLRQGGS